MHLTFTMNYDDDKIHHLTFFHIAGHIDINYSFAFIYIII